MDMDALHAEIRRLGPWHYDVEVAPGVWTAQVASGVEYPPSLGAVSVISPERWMAGVARAVYPEGLEGRSVLDCGCNSGGYLFAAVRHGAGRCFGLDVREHWIRQGRFLAEHVPSAGVELVVEDVHALPTLGLAPFDITLFNGLFYHLPDPVATLRTAADLTRELLVLNTAYLPDAGDTLILTPESETQVMSGVNGLAWTPGSENVLRQILKWCGFPHARATFRRHAPGSATHRIELIAAREERTLARYDAAHPQRESWLRRAARVVSRS